MKQTKLGKAICAALPSCLAVSAFGVAGPALAQDAGQPDSQQLETVTVTGSRIRKADVETAQPILVLDRAAIEKQGFNTVVDILSNLTEAGAPPISRSSVLASGEGVGGYYVDLRGIGATRTLILLNGKRLGATSSGAQDLSQVPVAAVERVEVLKDGASAIYGSDAIAGVINVITRRNYDGAEASAYIGQYDQGDGTKQTYSMTLGSHNERGSITVATEYSKEDPTWARNRPYSRYNASPRHPLAGMTPVSQWGAFLLPNGCPGVEDSRFGLCTLNPGGNPFNMGQDGRPNDFHGTNSAGGPSDLTTSNDEMMGTTGLSRHALFVAAEYSITDNVKFSTDVLYNKRSTTQQVAGYPFTVGAFGLEGLSADSYYNPFGNQYVPEGEEGQSIYFIRRTWEVPRVTRSDLQTYRFSGTLEGSFEIAGRTWNWDVGGFVNTNDLLKTDRGDGSLPAMAAALGASFFNPLTKRVECGTAANPTPYGAGPGQCIPWNPFYSAGQVGPGSLTGNKDLQTFMFPFYHDTGRTKTVDYSANLTGSLFSLPAGDVSIATGYEHRQESGRFEPDASKQAGASTSLAGTMTKGRYKVDEYYVEVDVPVLKDVPFFKELTFNVAARYSDYTTFGETTNGKFSLTWRPIEDLLVRANYAEGFRAPTIGDLYGGSSQTFAFYTDPCDLRNSAGSNPAVLARCTGGFGGQNPTPGNFQQPGQGGTPCSSFPCQTGTPFEGGSNPKLTPELSTSKTAGLVYSPSWVQGLDLSLDWYNIRLKNRISVDSVSQMLQDCYVFGAISRCSTSLFTRDANGGLNTAHIGGINQGWQEVEGYDFGVNYRLPEFSFGRFRVSWDTTYTSLNNLKPDDKPATAVAVQNSFAGFPRIRSNLSLDWTLGDFGATWTTRYFSSMKEVCSFDKKGGPECNMPNYSAPDTGFSPTNRVGSTSWHDLQVRWTAPWNGTIAVGANNVFNKQPPIMYSAPNSQFSYYGGFDIGRFYYLRYTQKF
ncbi:TonB-dependent receptor [Dokdonella sp.]|uniref:TonB-dependent receptor plug domain-containing protein n=1 Tax=Dokdonella sp. TaxID=2291710 RepID=UPI001B1F7197|nr:TonB-dependent receptor [Dokdonella sp.]MBO9664890.1 TonB-dependent receptor [Dokdonella sp.]